MRFFANFVFSKGRINLLEESYKVELYQDDLSIKFTFRRDTTLDVIIGNQSVGLNVVDTELNIVKELVAKQARERARKNSLFSDEKA